jgi:hypothetical protein
MVLSTTLGVAGVHLMTPTLDAFLARMCQSVLEAAVDAELRLRKLTARAL